MRLPTHTKEEPHFPHHLPRSPPGVRCGPGVPGGVATGCSLVEPGILPDPSLQLEDTLGTQSLVSSPTVKLCSVPQPEPNLREAGPGLSLEFGPYRYRITREAQGYVRVGLQCREPRVIFPKLYFEGWCRKGSRHTQKRILSCTLSTAHPIVPQNPLCTDGVPPCTPNGYGKIHIFSTVSPSHQCNLGLTTGPEQNHSSLIPEKTSPF